MQELIVFVAVGGAACFLAARYTPKTVVAAAGRALASKARQGGHASLALRLEKAMQRVEGASSCGGCSGCKTTDAPRAQNRHSISVDALRRTAKR
jgi:hypothetical protein